MDPSFGKAAIEATLKELIPALLKKVKVEISHIISNRILEYEVTEYSRNYYTKTILNRAEPVPLSDFYLPLHIASLKNKYLRIPTLSVKGLMENTDCITLFGDAGSGKTTLTKYLFVDCIRSHYKIPLKIELRYLSSYPGSLIDYIKLEVLKLQKLAQDDAIMERLLLSGDFAIFLDGYDEIRPTDIERVTKDIDNLVKVFPQNKYFLTSRPNTKIDLLPGFVNYEICGFNEKEVEEFVKKQLISEQDLAAKMIQAIKQNEVKHFQEFFSNPLLVSMFVLTFRRFRDVPTKRSDFYSRVFNALYAEHDEISKPGFKRTMRSDLNRDDFEKILKIFSFISYFENKFSFGADYLEKRLNDIKAKKESLIFDIKDIITDFETIGILHEDGFDHMFPHRSMQEYFTACYIANMETADKNHVYKVLSEKVTNSTGFIPNNKNFFFILMEMDFVFMAKYVLLAALEVLYQQVKAQYEELQRDFYSERILYYFSELNFLVDNFLFSDPIFEGHFHELREISFSATTNDSDASPNAAQSDLAWTTVSRFISNHDNWVREMNDVIHAKITSDAGIIDLIQKL